MANSTSTPGALERKTLEESEGQIEDCKVGAGDWLVQNFEPNKDSTGVNHHIHSPTSISERPSTNESEQKLFNLWSHGWSSRPA